MNGWLTRRAPARLLPITLTAAVLLIGAPGADAGQVVINGVSIGTIDMTVDGLKGIKLTGCSNVKIDAQGNVDIVCPGYDLQAAGAAPTPPASTTPAPAPAASDTAPVEPSLPPPSAQAAPTTITKHYWLVTEQPQPGAAQYDIDLFVNSKWIRTLHSSDPQVVFELTPNLQPGDNKIVLTATKHLGGGRISASPSVFYRVVIGEGDVGGGNVMISNPLIDWRVTAAQTQNVTAERDLYAK